MRKIVIITKEKNAFIERVIKELTEFTVQFGSLTDLADLHIQIWAEDIKNNQIILIKDGQKDTLNLNCKFFNFDNKFYQPGFPIERRDTVAIILRNSKQEIAGLSWNNEKNWKSFVSGGVDNGDIIQSAIDEIKEEAGYVNVEFVRQINCEARDKFFAPHKKVNRYLSNRTVVFDLLDEERVEIDPKELAKHTPLWIPESEVLDWLSIDNHKFMFREYLGKKQEYDSIAVLVKDILK